MAEETPAVMDQTVIWRPLDEDEYRMDHVTCEAGCKTVAVTAAADKYIGEYEYADGEEPLTAAGVIATGYDLIGVYEGHLRESVAL